MLAFEVHEPDFGDPRGGAGGHLHRAVVQRGGVGDLDDQQDVRGLRVPLQVGSLGWAAGPARSARVNPRLGRHQ
jgi:hypothetical protein